MRPSRSSTLAALVAAVIALVIAVPAGAATPPVVPFDDTGDLFLLDDGSDSVLRVSGTTITVAVSEAQLQAITPGGAVSLFNRDLAFDAAGTLFLTVGHGETVGTTHPLASLVKVDARTGNPSVLLSPAAAQAASGMGTASDMRGVAVGPDGKLYVNDTGTDTILRVDPASGAAEKVVNRTDFGNDQETGSVDLDGLLVVDANGDIYVSSVDGPTGVYRIDPDATTNGGNITVLATETGLTEVQHVWTNATGGTFTLAYDPPGADPKEETGSIAYNASAAAVEAAIEALDSIVDVTVSGAGTQGNPWRVEWPAGINPSNLQRPDDIDESLTPSGSRSFVSVVQFPNLTEPNGITVDNAGNVYVADQGGAQTIYKITPGGAVSVFVSTSEIRALTGLNDVDLDAGLAFDDAGNLFFGETESASLLRFDAAGTSGAVVLSDKVANADDFRDATGTGAELKGAIEFGLAATSGGGTGIGGGAGGSGGAGGASADATDGYWFVGADGGIFSFGAAPFLGSTGSLKLNQPIVGMANRPAATGYWFVASDGGIFSFGAPFLGSTGAIKLNQPIVGMAATPSGNGYWLVASDGGIFTFGDAAFLGSTGAIKLNQPIVGMAATPSGNGYWLVASDGGIFTFANAPFFGSTGAMKLNSPIVGMDATPTGLGYWFVAADGGIFTFGDAAFLGSTGAMKLNSPIVGMAATR